jgi:hypothetical protein
MGEIAHHHQESEVVVVAVDPLDRRRKPRSGIERIETASGRNEATFLRKSLTDSGSGRGNQAAG